MGTMENLPDCILLMIFSNVSQEELCLGLRMTCKRWWRLSHDRCLWKVVDIPYRFTDKRLLTLLSCIHERVEEINCDMDCENLTKDGFASIADLEFPRLKKLSIPVSLSYILSNDIYLKLSRNCRKLEELRNVNTTGDNNGDPLCIQSMFPGLTVLHDDPTAIVCSIINYNAMHEDQWRQHWRTRIKNVATCCPNVHFYSCQTGEDFPDDDDFEFISTSFPNLKQLELDLCSLKDEAFDRYFRRNKSGLTSLILVNLDLITNRALVTIADNCPGLLKLKIVNCIQITDKGIKYLVEKCPKLTDIHLNSPFCDEVVDDGTKFTNSLLWYISVNCPNLQFFSLYSTTDVTHAGIEHLVDRCRFLRGVELCDCPAIDDRCLISLMKLPYLISLDLKGSSHISPMGILNFLLRVPNVSRLTFYANSDGFRGDLKDLALEVEQKMKTCRPNVVTEIAVTGVGSDFLQLLAMVCPLLETLSVKEHGGISLGSLNAVVSIAKGLRFLDVASDKDIDDSFLQTVINDGKQLSTLRIGGVVEGFIINTLVDVIRTCPLLKEICLNHFVGDEMLLRDAAEDYHGGQCSLHVETDGSDAPKLVVLNFTPIKYTSSISTV